MFVAVSLSEMTEAEKIRQPIDETDIIISNDSIRQARRWIKYWS